MKSLYESILSGFDDIETDFVKKYSWEKYFGDNETGVESIKRVVDFLDKSKLPRLRKNQLENKWSIGVIPHIKYAGLLTICNGVNFWLVKANKHSRIGGPSMTFFTRWKYGIVSVEDHGMSTHDVEYYEIDKDIPDDIQDIINAVVNHKVE